MTPGDVVLVAMPMRNGKTKKRPALVLQVMAPFNDLLVCGISSQTQYEVKGFDIILDEGIEGFGDTGLKRASLIRIGYITTVANSKVPGKIGKVPQVLFAKLITRLTAYLEKGIDK